MRDRVLYPVQIIALLSLAAFLSGCPAPWTVDNIAIPSQNGIPPFEPGYGATPGPRAFAISSAAGAHPVCIHKQEFRTNAAGNPCWVEIGMDYWPQGNTSGSYAYTTVVSPQAAPNSYSLDAICGLSADFGPNGLEVGCAYWMSEGGVTGPPEPGDWDFRSIHYGFLTNVGSSSFGAADVLSSARQVGGRFLCGPGTVLNQWVSCMDFKYTKDGEKYWAIAANRMVDGPGLCACPPNWNSPSEDAYTVWVYGPGIPAEGRAIDLDTPTYTAGDVEYSKGTILDLHVAIKEDQYGHFSRLCILYSRNAPWFSQTTYPPTVFYKEIMSDGTVDPDTSASFPSPGAEPIWNCSLLMNNGCPMIAFSNNSPAVDDNNHVYFAQAVQNGNGYTWPASPQDLTTVNVAGASNSVKTLGGRGARLGGMSVNPGDGQIAVSIQVKGVRDWLGDRMTTYVFRKNAAANNTTWSTYGVAQYATDNADEVRPLIVAASAGTPGTRSTEYVLCRHATSWILPDYGVAHSQ